MTWKIEIQEDAFINLAKGVQPKVLIDMGRKMVYPFVTAGPGVPMVVRQNDGYLISVPRDVNGAQVAAEFTGQFLKFLDDLKLATVMGANVEIHIQTALQRKEEALSQLPLCMPVGEAVEYWNTGGENFLDQYVWLLGKRDHDTALKSLHKDFTSCGLFVTLEDLNAFVDAHVDDRHEEVVELGDETLINLYDTVLLEA